MARINQDLSDVTKEDMEHTGGKWRALEAGDYRFMLTDSHYKDTRAGDGGCLHLFVQCIEPEFARSKWREFLTLEHPNETTVQIAKAKLKQLAIAVEHPTPDYVKESSDLHNIPFIASVVRETADDPKYGDADGWVNKIIAYKPIQEAPKRQAAPASALRSGGRTVEGPPNRSPSRNAPGDDIPF